MASVDIPVNFIDMQFLIYHVLERYPSKQAGWSWVSICESSILPNFRKLMCVLLYLETYVDELL